MKHDADEYWRLTALALAGIRGKAVVAVKMTDFELAVVEARNAGGSEPRRIAWGALPPGTVLVITNALDPCGTEGRVDESSTAPGLPVKGL